MNILLLFVILSIINVITATIRSIVTIRGNKWVASFVSAGYFAFYNIMLIYTVSDFPLWQKIIVTFGCNLVGVFIVKLVEEKSRKDKLWKIELTVPKDKTAEVDNCLQNVPHSYVFVGNHTLFNFYCNTQAETTEVKKIVEQYDAKYFVSAGIAW